MLSKLVPLAQHLLSTAGLDDRGCLQQMRELGGRALGEISWRNWSPAPLSLGGPLLPAGCPGHAVQTS